ncbi:MAG: putative ABC transporter permease [Spirochaetales bacterium]|uniref:ABC transporter permease n=1 Tax=Candidatus Thalassospirochaeta sargassi TaxID=3119039 RepID=A0AAJ1MPH7_9SPIO|nr:putative ABC transporter permease [Spirochaetales bacterium]
MLDDLVLIFFVFAVLGWLIEVAFRSIYLRHPVNPGFHKGPWLPLYGSAGSVNYLVSSNLSSYPLMLRMLFYLVLCTAFEFLAGVFLEKVFHKRYWDYSEHRFNIRGLVCPVYSIGWVVISVIVELFILPEMQSLIVLIPDNMLLRTDLVLISVFGVDFMFSSGIASRERFNRLRALFS